MKMRDAMSLSEGLIKIPTALRATVMSIVAERVLWMLRDRFTAAMKAEFPDHWKTIGTEAKRWGVRLPRTKFKTPERGFEVVPGTLDMAGLPGNYDRLKADRSAFYVVVDFTGLKGMGRSLASFSDRTNRQGEKEALLVIHLPNVRGLKEYPGLKRHADEVTYILDYINGAMDHELRHLVQYVMLASTDKRQVEKLPGYGDKGTDYYASPVEYDPQIGDAVQEFLETWKIVSRSKKLNLAKSIRSYVGIDRKDSFEVFSVADIFKALRKRDPSRYRDAVKKFYVEVMAAMRAEMAKKP